MDAYDSEGSTHDPLHRWKQIAPDTTTVRNGGSTNGHENGRSNEQHPAAEAPSARAPRMKAFSPAG